MAGNKLGAIKAKMGLKGKQPVGAMISRMNEMKVSKLSKDIKVVETIKKII